MEDGGLSMDLAAQAEWVIAMAWHLEPGRRTRAARAQTFLWRQLIAADASLPFPLTGDFPWPSPTAPKSPPLPSVSVSPGTCSIASSLASPMPARRMPAVVIPFPRRCPMRLILILSFALAGCAPAAPRPPSSSPNAMPLPCSDAAMGNGSSAARGLRAALGCHWPMPSGNASWTSASRDRCNQATGLNSPRESALGMTGAIMSAKAPIRQAHIERTVRAVMRAGIPVGTVVISPTGEIRIYAEGGQDVPRLNPLDRLLPNGP
jgi:hypothetical protein